MSRARKTMLRAGSILILLLFCVLSARDYFRSLGTPLTSAISVEQLLAEADFSIRAGRFEEAIATSKRLAQLLDGKTGAAWVVGVVEEARGRPLRAVEAFETVWNDKSDRRFAPPRVRTRLVTALLRLGRPTEALDLLQARFDGEDFGEVHWLQSRARLQLGDVVEASKALELSKAVAAEDLLRPEPSPYLGQAACARCHASISKDHLATSHARTLRQAEHVASLDLPNDPILDPVDPAVSHQFRRNPDGTVEVRTIDPGGTMKALVLYALGSGEQGVSFVARSKDGAVRECRISRFADTKRPSGHSFGKTILHPERPIEAGSWLGRRISEDERYACLGCHATTPRAADERTGPEALDHSIGCERCHGPGGNHQRAVDLGWDDLAIVQPGRAKAARIVVFCGECHDNPRPSPETSADPAAALVTTIDPAEVRLQSRTLVRSRCFTESEGTLSCLTCHDPHRDAERDTSYYVSKCLECHAKEKPRGAARTCQVNPAGGCLSCHMPKDAKSIVPAVYTDHWIRVHPGDGGKASAGVLSKSKPK